MLGKNKRRNVSIETLVGASTRVSGDLFFTGASHVDGMLHIDLAREVPEALKPRRIAITKADTVDGRAVEAETVN